MKLIFSRAVVHDLVRLREFIAKHNQDAAKPVSQRLRGAIKGLVNNPQIGRPVPGLSGEIRELIFGKYIARYEVRTNSLYVLRIIKKVCVSLHPSTVKY
jgi:toxin ParE1/3/4